jgi:hypothetical protein
MSAATGINIMSGGVICDIGMCQFLVRGGFARRDLAAAALCDAEGLCHFDLLDARLAQFAVT